MRLGELSLGFFLEGWKLDFEMKTCGDGEKDGKREVGSSSLIFNQMKHEGSLFVSLSQYKQRDLP